MARPVEYNREEVVEKAMQAFWKKGYHATSMADLVEATGLNPGSIYAAFKSKENFFITTIDYYGEKGIIAVQRMLIESPSFLEGVRAFIQRIEEDVADPESKRSCFLVNTLLELARQSETARQRVKRHLDLIESLIRHALETAQQNGELSAKQDSASLAAFIMCTVWGLRVLGGTLPSRERTQMVTSHLLAMIG